MTDFAAYLESVLDTDEMSDSKFASHLESQSDQMNDAEFAAYSATKLHSNSATIVLDLDSTAIQTEQ